MKLAGLGASTRQHAAWRLLSIHSDGEQMVDSRSYHHTQLGYVSLATMIGGVVSVLALDQLHVARIVLIITGTVLIVVGILFSSLTISVTSTELSHHFTLGFWHRRIPFTDIVSANSTRSSWLEGWGLRVTTRGMLYNVSGTHDVEVSMRDGRKFRVGTDEPELLLAAIRSAIRSLPPG